MGQMHCGGATAAVPARVLLASTTSPQDRLQWDKVAELHLRPLCSGYVKTLATGEKLRFFSTGPPAILIKLCF